MVGVVAARMAELMDTNHYTFSTCNVFPTYDALFVLHRWHTALLITSSHVYGGVTTITIFITTDALVTASSKTLTIFTSVIVLENRRDLGLTDVLACHNDVA